MQTFLPLPSVRDTAACLDYKRLGKQRVECKQILQALGVKIGPVGPKGGGWKNHPATKMWKGHENILLCYAVAICDEWISRGYRDTLREQFMQSLQERLAEGEFCESGVPEWLGDEDFHKSHRSNLLRKDPDHYGQFGWSEPNDLEYVWPTEMEGAK